MNETDTYRKHVRPKLESSAWNDSHTHFYSEQIHFTDGYSGKPKRLKKKIADFLLGFICDITQAVVEA